MTDSRLRPGTTIDFPQVANLAREDSPEPGTAWGYLATPSDGATGPGVVVLHAWWGLNDTFRDVCDRLAAEGYVALAPDLYGDGAAATTVDDAQVRVKALDGVRAEQTVLGAIERITGAPESTPFGVAVLGFSMGANFALWASAKRADDVAATILVYGTGAAGDGRSAVQGHFGPEDEWEPKEEVDAMVDALRAAGRSVEIYEYPGAKHWFTEPDRPEYDPQAAELAWERILHFLRGHLREEAP